MAEEIQAENTVQITYEVENGNLVEVRTPTEVQAERVTYNILQVQEELTKINNAISQWEAKKAPLQAIVDKYNEIVPQPTGVEEVTE